MLIFFEEPERGLGDRVNTTLSKEQQLPKLIKQASENSYLKDIKYLCKMYVFLYPSYIKNNYF